MAAARVPHAELQEEAPGLRYWSQTSLLANTWQALLLAWRLEGISGGIDGE